MSKRRASRYDRITAVLDDQAIPARFIDNGCSMSPDSILNVSIRWACRVHDWRYCTRAHKPGLLTDQYRKGADAELRYNIGAGLPWYSRWARLVYFWAVRKWGDGDHSFDTCDASSGRRCRHNMLLPSWMDWLRLPPEDL